MLASNAPARTTIYDAEYFRIELDARNGILWLVRSGLAWERLAEVEAAQTSVLDRLQNLARRHLALLVDLRDAPARNDPEFEDTVKEFRKQLFALFLRSGVLVRTATGKMQLTRHVRSDGGGTRIFDDEAVAVEQLRHK